MTTTEDQQSLQQAAVADRTPPAAASQPAPPSGAGAAPAPAPPQSPPPGVSQEQLLELGTRRGERVKDYLVGRHGIDSGRLFLCTPEVDEEDQAVPRVHITL